MIWSGIFAAVNLAAIIAWAILIFLPRKPAILSALLYLGVMALCLLYSLAMAGILTGIIDPVGGDPVLDFTMIEAVRAIFASDGGIVIGWVHYLAFDLFVGIWIARDADAKGFSRIAQAPILLLTFMAGPIGLLLWLLMRERRARAAGRWS